MRPTELLVALLVATGAAVAGCSPSTSDISFADYGEPYHSKHDFARIEHEMPLTRAQLDTLTPKNLETLTQEQLDQLYARLTAGPIPDGAYDGTFFFADGGGLRRLSDIVQGPKGKLLDIKLDLLERIGQRLWFGKVFYRDERVLRNIIEDRKYLEKLLNIDPDSIEQRVVKGRRQWLFFPEKAWLLFPAKLYCGQSLLDGRRESIIIDYAFNDQIPGYVEKPDYLVGRNGLHIRDEIRMIRPGFYLGRAYIGHAFGLNFTLYNEEVADAGHDAFRANEPIAEDCWIGTQRQQIAAAE